LAWHFGLASHHAHSRVFGRKHFDFCF